MRNQHPIEGVAVWAREPFRSLRVCDRDHKRLEVMIFDGRPDIAGDNGRTR